MLKLKKSNRKLLKYRGSVCLNCNHPLDLSDRYCPRCSQLNSTKRVTLLDLVRDFFDTIFSYDSKFRKTIWTLICHPGKITKEYTAGKRVAYSNPFRFFLSLSFIYIIVLLFSFDLSQIDEMAQKNFLNDNQEQLQGISKQLDSLAQQKLDSVVTANKDTEKPIPELDSPLAKVLYTGDLNTNNDSYAKKDSIHFKNAVSYFDSIAKTDVGFMKRVELKIDLFTYGIKQEKLYSYSHFLEDLKVNDTWENQFSYKLSINLYKLKTSPSLYFKFIISNLPFLIFFMIPFLSLFVWLIYNKQKFYVMDHMIFSYQTLTIFIFSFLIWNIITLIFDNTAFTNLLFFGLLIYNYVYLYKAMRGFYEQSRIKTFIKYIYINSIFSILAIVFITLFALISIILY